MHGGINKEAIKVGIGALAVHSSIFRLKCERFYSNDRRYRLENTCHGGEIQGVGRDLEEVRFAGKRNLEYRTTG